MINYDTTISNEKNVLFAVYVRQNTFWTHAAINNYSISRTGNKIDETKEQQQQRINEKLKTKQKKNLPKNYRTYMIE